MKVFLFLVLCGSVSLCCAEPQRYRSSRLRSRVLSRQEAAPSASASYPPSGWKPEGETLELPTEQTENLAPPAEYDSPAAEELEAEEPLAEEPEAEDFEGDAPEAEEVAPVAQSGRLRSPHAFLVNPAAIRRAHFSQQRAPAKLRRARF